MASGTRQQRRRSAARAAPTAPAALLTAPAAGRVADATCYVCLEELGKDGRTCVYCPQCTAAAHGVCIMSSDLREMPAGTTRATPRVPCPFGHTLVPRGHITATRMHRFREWHWPRLNQPINIQRLVLYWAMYTGGFAALLAYHMGVLDLARGLLVALALILPRHVVEGTIAGAGACLFFVLWGLFTNISAWITSPPTLVVLLLAGLHWVEETRSARVFATIVAVLYATRDLPMFAGVTLEYVQTATFILALLFDMGQVAWEVLLLFCTFMISTDFEFEATE